MDLLDDSTINAAIAGGPWERQGDALVRTVNRGDFAGSLAYVNQVGDLAEKRNHHPDIAISWATVTLTLSTHSAGGITQNDIELARAIDGLG
jgi:4a-hydroxytetrahydrobiopterin dehydratase